MPTSHNHHSHANEHDHSHGDNGGLDLTSEVRQILRQASVEGNKIDELQAKFPSIIGKPSEDGCGCLVPPDITGPMLQYTGMDLEKARWMGSVLYIVKDGVLQDSPPRVTVMDGDALAVQVVGVPLFKFLGWTFWRYDLSLPLGVQDRKVFYKLVGQDDKWAFHVPAHNQTFHWSYYSCAGFSSDMPESERKIGFSPLWIELLKRHTQHPYHMIFGGGDQLYNDQVFRLHTVGAWMKQEPSVRNKAPFTQEMKEEAEAYYFIHYMVHYNEGVIKRVMGGIPHVMMWDDHDIFDGYGSYDEGLQQSAPFIGLYEVARKFYLLFQHHTTDDMSKSHGLIRQGTALSRLALLGPNAALLAADMRSERRRNQIMPQGAWPMLMEKLRELPSTVKHLVVGSGVPVVYPSLAEVEYLMEAVSEANSGKKSGRCIQFVAKMVGKSKFDEPELLDDLLDHWNAEPHLQEKREMIQAFQEVAKERGLRVSFISGDVHLCATGRLRAPGHVQKEEDHKYMLQVVSSAIVNRPPPDGLVTFLSQKALYSQTLMNGTEERMRATFGGLRTGTKAKLLNRRNFCDIRESSNDGSLVFTLVVEAPHGGYKEYPSVAPALRTTKLL